MLRVPPSQLRSAHRLAAAVCSATLLAVVVSSMPLVGATARAPVWAPVGSGRINSFPGGAPTSGFPTSLAETVVGTSLFVAYTGVGANTLYVSELGHHGWHLVGDPVFPGAPYTVNDFVHDVPSVSMTSIGTHLYVTYMEWNEPAHVNQIHVRTLTGQHWVDVGGTSLNTNVSDPAGSPRVADVNGSLVVTWEESVGGVEQVFVKRWTGVEWITEGAQPLNLNPAASASDPVIASVGSFGVVAFYEHTSTSLSSPLELVVERDIAGVWHLLGAGPVPGAVGSPDAGLSIADVAGTPWVSWGSPTGTGSAIHVDRLTTGGWVPVGGVANPAPREPASARLAVLDARPYLVLVQSNGTVLRTSVLRLSTRPARWIPSAPGIDLRPGDNGDRAVLFGIGHEPYVVWLEGPAASSCGFGSNIGCAVYAKRLVPVITAMAVRRASRSLECIVHLSDAGFRVPLLISYGRRGYPLHLTKSVLAPGMGLDTVVVHIAGLAPRTTYSLRAEVVTTTGVIASGPTAHVATAP